MEQKILNYSISLAFCLLLSLPLQAQNSDISAPPANTPPKKEKKEAKEEVHYPLYNGISVSVDLWGPGSKLFGSDFFSSEVAVDVNLKNRFFPIVELGYGNTDTWSDKGIHYKTGAPYFRIGMDYNALYNKKHGHMILVGLRYAATSFKYDVEALGINDPEYGGSLGNPNLIDGIWGNSLPFNYKGMKGSMQWAEFCVGIRAHVWKDLYMGWALRFKFRMSSSVAEHGDPWYVPGYGKYFGQRLHTVLHESRRTGCIIIPVLVFLTLQMHLAYVERAVTVHFRLDVGIFHLPGNHNRHNHGNGKCRTQYEYGTQQRVLP